MVKTFTKKGGSVGGSSKIRFVMLDAELKDGDITEITQAISSALRQVQPSPRQIAARVVPAEPEAGGNDVGVVEEVEQEPAAKEVDETPRATKHRKPTIPKVLDVDLKSGEMSFDDFATKKAPTSDLARHLVVAYWFKKYRDVTSVTPDHAFTCYKKAGWPTNIVDFAQPFRDLGRARKGDMKAKSFTINQIGEDAVEKMGSD